jgi:hypothetical protein
MSGQALREKMYKMNSAHATHMREKNVKIAGQNFIAQVAAPLTRTMQPAA